MASRIWFSTSLRLFLSLLDTKTSLVQNIDRLFFQRNAVLKLEFDELYSSLFKNADKYIRVVQVLAQHKDGLTRKQIGELVDLEGKMLTQVIKNLNRCDFILRYGQYGSKVKDAICRLSDFYTLFYYQFVANNTSQDEQWWSHNFNSHSIENWQGHTFELVCMMYPDAIKRKLGISGVATSISSWRYIAPANSGEKGTQIDMLIERSDRIINVCEMKCQSL